MSQLTFWLACGVLAAFCVALLAMPVLRARGATPLAPGGDEAEAALAVYRDQLAELDRDRARGLLDERESASARLEIQRRILAAAARLERTRQPGGGGPAPVRGSPLRRPTLLLLIVALPAFALALYDSLGEPGLPAAPFAQRAAPMPDVAREEFEALTETLARRVAERPEDFAGWRLLGRSYLQLGRFADAAAAFGHARLLRPDDALIAAEQGEALVHAAQGEVTVAATEAFRAALAADAEEPRSRFFLALAEAQADRPEAALRGWLALLADTPPDAPWATPLAEQIAQTARVAGLDPQALAARQGLEDLRIPLRQVPQDGIAALPEAEQEAAIRGMVDGLAARLEQAPEDLEGWLRLGQARRVLGEPAAARDAYARAAALAPEDLPVVVAYADSILAAAGADGAALAAARVELERLRQRLPDGHPGREAVAERLRYLPDAAAP